MKKYLAIVMCSLIAATTACSKEAVEVKQVPKNDISYFKEYIDTKVTSNNTLKEYECLAPKSLIGKTLVIYSNDELLGIYEVVGESDSIEINNNDGKAITAYITNAKG